jgi:hypothetical protein
VEWLWRGYLARGKFSLLDGNPGMGKSLIAVDLIARLTRGGTMPDGSALPGPVTCIIFSTEDDAEDTIRPRAEAAGADLERLVIPRFVGRVPRLPDDLPAIEQLIRDSEAGLLVLDPFMAFLPPRVAANLDQCVRQALTPLAELAARTRCAVLALRHLTKARRERALLRGEGSMAICGVARTHLFAAPHPDDPASGVLAAVKSNIGQIPSAQAYRVCATDGGPATIQWTGLVELTADGLCQKKKAEATLQARDRATDWLRRELANGPRLAAHLYAAAAAALIPERTLERAKVGVKAKSYRHYDVKAKRGEWWWYDPDVEWPKDAPFKRPTGMEMPPLWEG